jgi:hypothetical protein
MTISRPDLLLMISFLVSVLHILFSGRKIQRNGFR